jgi:F-type H+-transporting ATPase subunit b
MKRISCYFVMAALVALTAPALLAQASDTKPVRHEEVFDWINLVILIAVLVYFLRKPIREFFSHRSDQIQKGLEEGRKALETAQAQLATAEEKLRHLQREIAALEETAARDTAAERERLRKAAEEEARRMLESGRSMIETATQAAKMDLKAYAARQASVLAEKIIRERMDDGARNRLVSRFIEEVPGRPNGKQGNR